MFGKLLNKAKKVVDETEQIDDRFYAQVMDELSQGFKNKAAVGKAIAQCDGNESKFDSTYVKIRAKALQEEFLIHQEQQRIKEEEQLKLKEQNTQLDKKIARAYRDFYFEKFFKDEIEAKGFKVTFFKQIKKDGIVYGTGMDYENRDFLILDTNRKPLHRFHIKIE